MKALRHFIWEIYLGILVLINHANSVQFFVEILFQPHSAFVLLGILLVVLQEQSLEGHL